MICQEGFEGASRGVGQTSQSAAASLIVGFASNICRGRSEEANQSVSFHVIFYDAQGLCRRRRE
jgi:hypothetical protein